MMKKRRQLLSSSGSDCGQWKESVSVCTCLMSVSLLSVASFLCCSNIGCTGYYQLLLPCIVYSSVSWLMLHTLDRFVSLNPLTAPDTDGEVKNMESITIPIGRDYLACTNENAAIPCEPGVYDCCCVGQTCAQRQHPQAQIEQLRLQLQKSRHADTETLPLNLHCAHRRRCTGESSRGRNCFRHHRQSVGMPPAQLPVES